jgi:ABC-type branched-subunit amino acid transport system permease subunit
VILLPVVVSALLMATISGSAWNLLSGHAGRVPVSHAVYSGAGAYAGLTVYTEWCWPPIAGAPPDVAVSAVLAVVVRLYKTLRRLRGQGLTLLLAEQATDLARHTNVQRIHLGSETGAAS